jgi:hypothetical protein
MKRGFILHETKKIVCICTTITKNPKTGKMLQIWFLEKNVSPLDSVKSGSDAKTVCKGCIFASGNGCYVNAGQAPQRIWEAYHRGIYEFLPVKEYSKVFSDRKVRFGAYGNPSLLPISLVKRISEVSSGWTGYFHDWQDMQPGKAKQYADFLMVSTETEKSRRKAERMKLRYFHVSPVRPRNTRECLATSKGLTCEECLLCVGNSKPKQKSIWIDPHGSRKRKATEQALQGFTV